MTRGGQVAWLGRAVAAGVMVWALAACGGDDGGKGADAPNNAVNNDVNNDAPNNDTPNNDPNNDQNNDVNNDVNNDLPDADMPDADEPDADMPDADEPDVDEDEPPGEDDVGEPDAVDSTCSLDNPCVEGTCALEQGVCVDKSPCFGPLDCLGGELGDRLCAGCEDGGCGPEGGVCRDRCVNSGQCPEGQRCIDGGCGLWPELECNGDADCPGDQRCDSQAFACVDAVLCDADEDCAGSRRCETGSGVCRECLRDRDCGGLQVCAVDIFTSVCEEPRDCLGDADCLGLRRCDQDTGRCVHSICVEDRFEPNNRTNENVVQLDEGVITGLRVCGGEADLFLVSPPPGRPMVALTRVVGGPLNLFVYPGGVDPFDPNGAPEPIGASTGSDARQGVFIPAVDGATTYLLRVTSPIEGVKNYELEITFDPPEREVAPCPPDEPNQSPEAAALLTRDAPARGLLCADEGQDADEDWFRFQAAAGQTLELSVIHDIQGPALELDLFQRVDDALVPVEAALDPRPFGTVAALGTFESPAALLARVRTAEGGVRLGFSLALSVVQACQDDDLEPNNSPLQVAPLSVDPDTGVADAGRLAVCLNDPDYFVLNLLGQRGLEVTATIPEGFQGAPPSLSILELRQDDSLVPVGRLDIDARRSRVSLGDTGAGGTFIVEVLAAAEGITTYDLVATVFDEPFCDFNDGFEPNDRDNLVPMESTSLSAFLCPGEEDGYRVTVADGQTVDIELTGPQGLVFDVVRVQTGIAVRGGVQGRFQEAVSPGGQLAIVVRGQDGQDSGNYSLRTNVTADPPANDQCAGVQSLEAGVETPGTLRGATDSVTSLDPIGCFTLGGSPDVVYGLSLGAAAQVTIDVTPRDGQQFLQPTVFLQSDCEDPGSALEGLCASDFDDIEPGDGTVTLRTRLAAGSYFLWVDGATEGAIGDFDVLWQIQ